MDHVANYYLTGRELRPDGTTELLPAHEYGALVLEYEHLEDFIPASDIAAIFVLYCASICSRTNPQRPLPKPR